MKWEMGGGGETNLPNENEYGTRGSPGEIQIGGIHH